MLAGEDLARALDLMAPGPTPLRGPASAWSAAPQSSPATLDEAVTLIQHGEQQVLAIHFLVRIVVRHALRRLQRFLRFDCQLSNCNMKSMELTAQRVKCSARIASRRCSAPACTAASNSGRQENPGRPEVALPPIIHTKAGSTTRPTEPPSNRRRPYVAVRWRHRLGWRGGPTGPIQPRLRRETHHLRLRQPLEIFIGELDHFDM